MQHQLTRWKLEYRAAELSQQVWNGANNRPLEDFLAISQAEKTIQKAAERTCVRPALPAPPFAQLHRECTQWHRSLGAPASVLELSAELKKGGANAITREKSWQESSERFAERLATGFSGYEDVAGPLRLALYEVKHGLRTQAAVAMKTAFAAADGSTETTRNEAVAAQGLMRSLLVFPQRPPTQMGSHDLPAALVSLLQPLPSSLVAAPSGADTAGDASRLRLQRWRVSQQTNLLVLALRRLYVMVLLSGNARPSHLKALNGIMAAFARMQVEVEAAEARRLAAAQEPKHKAQSMATVDASRGDRGAQPLPDYEHDFKDLEQRASDAAFEAALPPMPRTMTTMRRIKRMLRWPRRREGKEGKATDDAETQRVAS